MTPILSRLGFSKGFGRRQGGPASYAFTQGTTSVNESSPFEIDVATKNVKSGTLLYFTTIQVSGTINASDFSDNSTSGSFVISNNSGTLTRTLASDNTTEGTESFQIEIREGSVSGVVLFTSDTVTVSDSSQQPALTVRYLVVAGGGGGDGNNGGGGGGAGGFREASGISLSTGTNYPVVIGAGGAGGLYTPNSGTSPIQGNNSTFNNFSSFGGGKGGGGNGGSGGGGFLTPYPNGWGGSGSSYPGPTQQGYPGGDGPYPTPNNTYGGGGGGGAGGAGSPNLSGGAGGFGASSDIKGYSQYYAGGGGGAGRASWDGSTYPQPEYAGSGGYYGGGNATTTLIGNNGVNNTGGGGGAVSGFGNNYQVYPQVGGSGGSGIVILRYPKYHTISNPGGGLVMTTNPAPNNDKYTEITVGTGNVSWS